MVSVCVIGAGVIGLSSAVVIQERLPAANVTLISDRFNQHTTSFGSGGMIIPVSPDGLPKDVGRQWCQDSCDQFYKLAFSAQAKDCGVSPVTGYFISDKEEQRPRVIDYLVNIRKMDDSDLSRFGRKIKYGYTATACLVELPVYLDWLMTRFEAKGGKVVKRKVTNFEELVDFDVVINCTGLGSRELANDPTIRPCRGQTVHVKAPWIKTFVRMDGVLHIFPFRDTVFLGSVKQDDNSDMSISDADSQTILERAQEIFPPLQGAKVIWEWVGLRPQRNSPRVEVELISTTHKPLKVVHNYGHGSHGIGLSWGSAIYAAKLVENLLNRSASKL